MSETAIPKPVKLSCKHLWKVYGDKPQQFFKSPLDERSSSDIDQLANRMRQQNHMPAAIDVSFDVREGEIFVIMGLSGSGKSTVVRCLSRLVDATHGEVLLDGEDLLAKNNRELIEIRRHKMGMVFQNFGLLPNLSVYDNVAFPLKLQKMSVEQQHERASRVIDLVGLTGRENSYPHQLSGGQQQRVGIARSLAVEPDVWFLDEPFSALDPLIRRQMQDEFLRIQQVLNKSIVFITHDFLEALRIADRIAIMRDGKIVQIDTPQALILNPIDDYVAKFTSEVPKIKILQAYQCMENNPSPESVINSSDAQIEVDADLPLEKVLQILSANADIDKLRVLNAQRHTLGLITAKSIVDVLGTGLDKQLVKKLDQPDSIPPSSNHTQAV
jgi:glycine betaine/proline transport system ATP-binding protein